MLHYPLLHLVLSDTLVSKKYEPNANTPNANTTEYETDFDEKNVIALSFQSLLEGNIDRASYIIRRGLAQDTTNHTLRALILAIDTWDQYFKDIAKEQDILQKAHLLINKWYEFKSEFYLDYEFEYRLTKELLNFVQKFISKTLYATLLYNSSMRPDQKKEVEFRFLMYKALKLQEEHYKALQIIKILVAKDSKNSRYLSELADSYYLCNLIDFSKLLFKEAFFIDPFAVRLTELEAPFIHVLYAKIIEHIEASKDEALAWIPIFGYLDKVFNKSRMLRPVEKNDIVQSITEFEAKLEDTKALGLDDPVRILPLLLNKYLWMLDVYQNQDSTLSKKSSTIILQKIKRLSPSSYAKLEANYATT